METNKKLFSEFTPVTKEQWIEKVNADLKGEDFNKKLVWKHINNFNLQPFYGHDDVLNYVANTGENAKNLINYRNIQVESASAANSLALQAVNEGATGLLFSIKETISIDALLKGINLNQIAVSFNIQSPVVAFAIDFFAYVEQNIKTYKNLRGYIDLGLISNYTTKGTLDETLFQKLVNLVKLGKDYPNFKTVTISGTSFLDSGSNQVQEIAYTLNALVYVIEQLTLNDVDVKSVFNNLNVQLGIGSEYFIEIGKFRAFNSLLNEIANKYHVAAFNHTVTAKTSIWSKSVTDAHTNLLRATTEAMSAILGNVDAVLVDAFDSEFNQASPFSNRIATNISTILKEESYFGKVANPVDGSYYIETVTVQIADKALQLFKNIEDAGGFYQAFESQLIPSQIAEIRQEKIKLISQRRLPMVGVNKYPNLMETLSANILSNNAKTNPKVLTPRRATLEVEAVRKVTEQLVEITGKRPVVALTSFGNLTMRKARAAFSYDFVGVSGFNVLQEQSYDSAEQAAEQSAKSNADVVVICSSDPDYEEKALTFVEIFRKHNSEKVLLLAGNPVEIIESLTKAGLDGCIHLKSDVIDTITTIQTKIQNTYKLLNV